MGPEVNATEVSCQSQLGGEITSGGGFSMHHQRPLYQQQAVDSYLNSAAGRAASKGYNSYGRGYPVR